MDQKLLKTQLLSDLADKGCADAQVCQDCVNQAAAAGDMLSTYGEYLNYALSLYNAQMWGRKKNNDNINQERIKREKMYKQPNPCFLPLRREPKEGEIHVGKLILRKRPK